MATRVIFVSDTHLSPDAPEAQANWAAVVGYIAAVNPDLVVHLGDLSLDGARNPADLDHARRQLELLPVPWHAIPGNHDVGDNPLPGMPGSLAVNAARRQRWLDVVGPDWWSMRAGGWLLLGVNAQLAGSGLAAEASQWSWLGEQIAQAGEGARIALLSHKPLAVAEAELAAAPGLPVLAARSARSTCRPVRGRPACAGRQRPRAPVSPAHSRRLRSRMGAHDLGRAARPRAAGARPQASRGHVADVRGRPAASPGVRRAGRHQAAHCDRGHPGSVPQPLSKELWTGASEYSCDGGLIVWESRTAVVPRDGSPVGG